MIMLGAYVCNKYTSYKIMIDNCMSDNTDNTFPNANEQPPSQPPCHMTTSKAFKCDVISRSCKIYHAWNTYILSVYQLITFLYLFHSHKQDTFEYDYGNQS